MTTHYLMFAGAVLFLAVSVYFRREILGLVVSGMVIALGSPIVSEVQNAIRDWKQCSGCDAEYESVDEWVLCDEHEVTENDLEASKGKAIRDAS